MSIFLSDEKPLLKKSSSIFLAFLTFTIIYARNADAITITNNYISTNSPTSFYAWDVFDREVREFDRSQPNWDSIGNMGDRLLPSFDTAVTNIIDHASSIWESAIRDPFDLEITWSWDELNSNKHGQTNYDAGAITLNNVSDSWYIDIYPTTSEEYLTHYDNQVHWGGIFDHGWDSTSMNSNLTVDLYSIALHEIGHALGVSMSNSDYINETQPLYWVNDYDIDITSPLPNAGLEISMEQDTAHIIGDVLLDVYADTRTRDLITDWDILAVAQINNWSDVYMPSFDHMTLDEWYHGTQSTPEYTWESVNVPEPSTLILLATGIIGMGATRLRKKP